uniref:uncharacterized protein n=1 Tax=Myxine glutinosa TaxID=7769 RepID=UPI00358E7A13
MLEDTSPPVHLPAQHFGSTSLLTIIPISSHSHSLIRASLQTNDCLVNPCADRILTTTPLSVSPRVALFERSRCRRSNLGVKGASVDVGSRSIGVEVLYDEHALEIETGTTDDTCLSSNLNAEQYHIDAFPSTALIQTHTELQTEDLYSFPKLSQPLSIDPPLNKVHQYPDNFVHDGPSPEDMDRLFSTSNVKLRDASICVCSCSTFQTRRRPSISSITLTSRRKQKSTIPSETDPITHSLSLVDLHRSSPPTRSVLSFMHFWVSPKAPREPVKGAFMENPHCSKKELRLGLPSSKDAAHLTRKKRLASCNSLPSITQASRITDRACTMNVTFAMNEVEREMHGKANKEHKRTKIGSIGGDWKVYKGQNLVSRLSNLPCLFHHQNLSRKAPKVKREVQQQVENSMMHGVGELERSCGYLPELALVDAKSNDVAKSASWAWRLPINRKCPSASSHGVSWFIGTTRRPKPNYLCDPVLCVTSMRTRVHASLQESLRVSRPGFLSRSLSRQAKVAEHRAQRLGLKGKDGLFGRGRGYTRT